MRRSLLEAVALGPLNLNKVVAVVAAMVFAGSSWGGRVRLLVMLAAFAGPPAYDAHLRGLDRLQRAGLRRHVDRDGVRLEGSPRVPSRS